MQKFKAHELALVKVSSDHGLSESTSKTADTFAAALFDLPREVLSQILSYVVHGVDKKNLASIHLISTYFHLLANDFSFLVEMFSEYSQDECLKLFQTLYYKNTPPYTNVFLALARNAEISEENLPKFIFSEAKKANFPGYYDSLVCSVKPSAPNKYKYNLILNKIDEILQSNPEIEIGIISTVLNLDCSLDAVIEHSVVRGHCAILLKLFKNMPHELILKKLPFGVTKCLFNDFVEKGFWHRQRNSDNSDNKGGVVEYNCLKHPDFIPLVKFIIENEIDLTLASQQKEFVDFIIIKHSELADKILPHSFFQVDLNGKHHVETAVKFGSIDVIKILYEDLGFDLNKGFQPSIAGLAIQNLTNNSLSILEYLFANCISPKICNEHGETLLHILASLDSLAIAKGKTECDRIIDWHSDNSKIFSSITAILKLLLGHGLDINAIDNSGESPIFKVADEKVFKLFILHGALINIKNNSGSYMSTNNIYGNYPSDIAKFVSAIESMLDFSDFKSYQDFMLFYQDLKHQLAIESDKPIFSTLDLAKILATRAKPRFDLARKVAAGACDLKTSFFSYMSHKDKVVAEINELEVRGDSYADTGGPLNTIKRVNSSTPKTYSYLTN